MARIRTIKPEFWTDGDIIDLSPHARLLFIGSWNFAMCDFGHVADDPRRLKMQVLPADRVNADKLVDELIQSGRMQRIDVDGRSFLHIKRFTDHQKTEKRWTPRCPACAATSPNHAEPPTNSPSLPATPTTSAPERKGKERKGELQSVSNSPMPVDNDGLTRIEELTRGNRAHAEKTVKFILAKAPADVRDPTRYVIKAITTEPELYRYRRGNPTKATECKQHMGEWGDNCRICRTEGVA